MTRNNKIKRIFVMILIIAITMSTTAYATSFDEQLSNSAYQRELEEAEEYLRNFCEIETNDDNVEFTTVYKFNTDHDLNRAAAYIVDYGLDAFNAAVDAALDEAIRSEAVAMRGASASPPTQYVNISGNGTHNPKGTAYALVQFPRVGNLEYLAELSYSLTVSNGQITKINSASFDIPYMTANGSWGNLAIPFYTTSYVAGATANYDVSKSILISVGDFEFEFVTDATNATFTVTTYLV